MAWLGMVMLIVPAVLMVSTIRFQSFKTFDLGIRRGFRGLMLVAAFIALLVAYPHELLIVIAYAYFASGFIGELLAKITGKKPDPAEVETEGFEEDAV
jgi:CDP-diacylglycerol---serine O-phosphatidyltransferase